MYPSQRVLLICFALLAMTAACGRGDKATPVPASPVGDGPGPGGGRPLMAPEPTPGVHFRLSDADPAAAEAAAGVRNVAGEELDGAAVASYLARLPALPASAAVTTTFALRPGARPPVVAGETRQQPWPPAATAEAPPTVAATSLTVARAGPEGDVPMATQLTVTFSEPMVPLTSHGALASEEVPVRLSPAPQGQWRWVGSKTLLFEPDPRFPQATEYGAEVPAGTKSARGATLGANYRWTFRTPPAELLEFWPGTPSSDRDDMPVTGRQPVLVASFDQRVEPEAVLGVVKAEAGGVAVALRLATAAEVEADEGARPYRDAGPEGRWAAFVPVAPLPLDTVVKVTVGPDVPSAEGPRTSDQVREFYFQVYGPMVVKGLGCDRPHRPDPTLGPYPWTDNPPTRIDRCRPGQQQWAIAFSNPLDVSAFGADGFGISPEVPGVVFEPTPELVHVKLLAAGRTEYVVHVPAGIKDIYGQEMAAAVDVTFVTGDADPALFVPGQDMLVLDPAAEGRMTMASINVEKVKVRLYKATPADWDAFRRFLEEWWRYAYGSIRPAEPLVPPGELVWESEIQPGGERDRLAAASIDLTPGLVAGVGHVIAVVEPEGWARNAEDQLQPHVRWVQVTKLGLKQARDAELRQVWVTDLADGSPLSGVAVRLEPDDAGGTTNGEGLAELQREAEDEKFVEGRHLIVRRGNDSAILPMGSDYVGYNPNDTTTFLWYVFDDRGIYRPGEEVHVKGWLRPYDWGKGGDLGRADPAITAIDYVLNAPDGEEIVKGSMDVSPAGGFDGAFTLPTDVELGDAWLSLTARGGDYDGNESGYGVQIAEFRRPEYEVTATAEEPDAFLGDTAYVQANASYYAGGALAGSEVTWRVRGSATTFSPPGHDDFIFGRWTPWWRGWDIYPPHYGRDDDTKEHIGHTDGDGNHRLAIELQNVVPLSPATIHAEATVEDVNRQAWSANATFLVHPARYYVGLRTDRLFADPGEKFTLEAIVADLDGTVVKGTPIRVVAERLDQVFRGGKYVEEAVAAGTCQLTSGAEPVPCALTFDQGGQYRVTAEIQDPDGRANVTELTLWVSGGETLSTGGQVEGQTVELIPDAKDYQPGDAAEILVRAPFSPAEGLMTLRRSGLVRTERFRVTDGSHTLRVPITEAELPNFTVQVDLVGNAPRRGTDGQPDDSLPPAPAFASGSLDIQVPPLVRTLTVEAKAQDDVLAPAATTTIDVTVTGPDGKPVSDAEVALVVADEAVMALTGYQIPDPIATFYPPRSADVSDNHLRQYVWLADPASLAAGDLSFTSAMSQGEERGGGGGGEAAMTAEPMLAPAAMADAAEEWTGFRKAERALAAESPVGVVDPSTTVAERSDLNPLALFAPTLVTGADGSVSAALKLPDNVTRYRITAVATDGGKRFGQGESSLTARLPLAVRPSAPRFLNFGDTFELPIVVQNQTDEDLTTDVVVRAANLTLESTGAPGVGRRITVPANDRVEVRFPAAAAMPGTAAFQAAAFSGRLADAQRVQLPTWTPATTEAFATYGEVDEGAIAQPVQRPSKVVEEFGGLEMTLTSTALGNLTDAFLYLKDYPFESSEAIASRLVATVALKDVLGAFEVPGMPDAATVDAAVRRDLDKLAVTQNWDGGFGWWNRYQPNCGSDPFLSTHVTHALARAQEKGYTPRQETLEQAKSFVRNIDEHMNACKYGGESRRTTKAYALYTMSLLGEADAAAAKALLAEGGEREIEALGWLLQVLTGDAGSADAVAEIRRQLGNRASEEASTAQFTSNYEESERHVVLASDRRADAVALEALIVDQPTNPLIPKLARGLLDHRVKGRWDSTQENGWVLLALDRYFRTYEGVTPDFVARAWLGDGFVGESAFHGRSADRSETKVPMNALAPTPTDLVLAKEGAGRLYYRLGLRYAPDDLELEPLERGFSVTREYAAVDDPDDVRLRADGSYEIKAGARVRVRLNMVADSRRYHVALVDPLPAGLEALNPDLAVTGDLPPDRGDGEGPDGPVPYYSWLWPWNWFDHQAFRDERTEAFTSLLDPGVYNFTYIARATTPGQFVVPPAKAEEMYHPETFGRSGTDRVRIR